MININLTPAEQAKLQLYEHIFAIAVFNGLLAAIIAIGQNQGPLNWNTLILVALSQGSLAAIDTLATYYKAHGQVQAASVLASVEKQEPTLLTKEAPDVAKLQAQVAPLEQAIMPALDAAFAISPPPVQATVAPIVNENPVLSGAVETVNTIPNLAAIKANLPATSN